MNANIHKGLDPILATAPQLPKTERWRVLLRFTSGQKPYLGDYSSEDAAKMRGPFQTPEKDSDMCWDALTGGGKGFLLVHGLTDSPYLMSNLRDSLHKAYPCALIRAVLLPGHGTVAGDSLHMKHEDWTGITEYGVKSFQDMDRIKDDNVDGLSIWPTEFPKMVALWLSYYLLIRLWF